MKKSGDAEQEHDKVKHGQNNKNWTNFRILRLDSSMTTRRIGDIEVWDASLLYVYLEQNIVGRMSTQLKINAKCEIIACTGAGDDCDGMLAVLSVKKRK